MMQTEESGQFLTFRVGAELYGLPISIVREVIEYPGVTGVPLTGSTIRGVMNLRGNVVTVMDLTHRFYGKAAVIDEKSCIIIADSGDLMIGMLIDGVNEVITLDPASMEDEPAFGARIPREYIEGIGKHNGNFVILLNAEKLLDVEELASSVGG